MRSSDPRLVEFYIDNSASASSPGPGGSPLKTVDLLVAKNYLRKYREAVEQLIQDLGTAKRGGDVERMQKFVGLGKILNMSGRETEKERRKAIEGMTGMVGESSLDDNLDV